VPPQLSASRCVLAVAVPTSIWVIVVLAGQHRRLSALYQQVAQIVAATLGDAAQAGLATAGILSRRQSQPGAKLCPVLELFEIPHRDDNSRRRDGANALEFGCPLNLFIIFLDLPRFDGQFDDSLQSLVFR